MIHLTLALTCWLAAWSLIQAQEGTAATQPSLHRDLVFGKGGDHPLKLDLAVPKGNGPFPVIVFIHGGGWKVGSYKDNLMQMIMLRFAKNGYVGACIQYRLIPTKACFPAQIEDCKCAVRWLRSHAVKYQLDPDRFGALGASAGGHLALLLGLTTRDDGLEGSGDLKPDFAIESSRVQAVVNIFGPCDIVNGNWDKAVEPLLVDLLGGPVSEKEALARQASPLTYVRKSPAPPPILTFHGTKDRIVPFIHATKLHEALDKIKADAKLITMEGEDHGWVGEKLERSLKQSEEFFHQHLQRRK